MSNIVERLRSPANVFYEYAADNGAFLREAADEITRLRAELAAALDAAATEKTLREHETKRANDNYASLTKHWLNESKLRELLTEIVEYNGGAGHALADEYVVARIKEEIRGE